jgi:hypothetical protein
MHGILALLLLAAAGGRGEDEILSLKFENDAVRVDITPGDGAFNLNDKRTSASLERVHLGADVVTPAGERFDSTLGRTLSCRSADDDAATTATCAGTTPASFTVEETIELPTARPDDLFAREFPEVWHVAAGPQAAVVGLFNWGRNVDLTQNPAVERADGAPVTHEVDLATLGLDATAAYLAYELWTDTYLGVVSGTLSLEVPPHAGRVVRLVPATTTPALVATNRHVLMGPGFVTDAAWSASAGALTATVNTAPGFAQTVVLYAAGLTATGATLDGAPVTVAQDGQAVRVSFTGADRGAHALSVAFGG